MYWTPEMLIEEAKKYKTRKEFLKNSPRAHAAVKRKDKEFIDECLSHMVYLKEKNKYTNEDLIKIGEQYDTPKYFRAHSPKEYQLSRFRNVYHQIKFKKGKRPLKYTKEEVIKMAEEYYSPIDLSKKNRKLYRYVERYNLYKEIKYKDGFVGNKLKRMVYVYEFSDNHFYCGLTCNKRNRHNSHTNHGPVYDHAQKTNLIPILIQVSSYILADEAAILEENTRLLYLEKGWIQLNRKKCGGLGGIKEIWTKEKIMKLALNFKFPSRFKNKHLGAYNAAKSLGIYDEVTKHMKHPYKKEDIIELSKKYFLVKDFKKNHPQMYTALICRGWHKEIFSNHTKHARVIIINKLTGIFYYTYLDAYNSKPNKTNITDFRRALKGEITNNTDFLLL